MTISVSRAVIESGLLPKRLLDEFRKWGAPLALPEHVAESDALVSANAIRVIEEALEEEGYQITRETDLEALQQYLQTQQIGTLSLAINGERKDFQVAYGRLSGSNEILIPWRADGVQDVMTNGETYLEYFEGQQCCHQYFKDVTELFFGEQKSFMRCSLGRLDKGPDNGDA